MRIAVILLSWLLGVVVASKQPNIVFVLTDDQDWHMDSVKYMPLLHKYVINEGTLYGNHYCTVAICCPSRVNLWTGRAAHNTNVTDVFPPYGGYPKIVEQNIHKEHLAAWLQRAGYNTYYVGKLYNAHTVDNYNSPYVEGFNGSDFLLDPSTYEYYRAKMTRNGAPPVSYTGQYSPDVVFQKAYDFLDEASLHPEPFFLVAAPVAPHSNVKIEPPAQFSFPKFAPRHANLFKDYKIPRTKNFNPEKHSGPSWIKHLPRLNDTVIEYNDEFQRARLRALQSVDEGVERLVKSLEAKGLLDNTYFIYSTDNGYHISQHRLHPGKECGYETDIHIPLVIRGPGVAAGRIAKAPTSHTDLAPTILKLAGATRDDFDGLPIPLTHEETGKPARSEHVNVEFWGFAIPEGKYGWYGDESELGNAIGNNTYKALRIISEEYSLYYSVWCTGELQYFDMKIDPDQVDNFFEDDAAHLRSSYTLAGRSFKHVVARLDALLLVLKSCKGSACTDPWSTLHPKGNVRTLKDALSKTFDAFYQEQPKVSFTACELGYIKEKEGPQVPNVFGERTGRFEGFKKQSFEYQGHWSIWT